MSYHDDEQEAVPKKEWVFPSSLATCVDKYYTLQQKRYKAQAVVKTIALEENALEEHILKTLPVGDRTGVAGKVARVSIELKEIPQVKDWPKFYAHILKTKSFELLNKAVNSKAVKERWKSGKTVPGTDKFIRKVLSVHKVTKGK